MLSVKERKDYFLLLGLGKYNKENIKKLQKKYFTNSKYVDGKYGNQTDLLLRNLYRVTVFAPHWKFKQMACDCGGRYCDGYPELLSIPALMILEEMGAKFGYGTITSALRDGAYNNSLTGSNPKSYHIPGRAFDFDLDSATNTLAKRKTIMQWLFKQHGVDYTYCNGWEIGTIVGSRKLSAPYMGNSIHFQVRKGTEADALKKEVAKEKFYYNNKHAVVKSVKIGQATSDERGKLRGGKVGDQTGKEVCISKWSKSSKSGAYNNWKFIARLNDNEKRIQMANIMIDICNNNKVGYNQAPSGGRKDLYEKLKAVKFKVKNLKVKVDTSCTPVVQACVGAVGIKIAQGSDAAHLEARIKSSKPADSFRIFHDSEYTHSIKNLRKGDIINSGRHSAMVVKVNYKVK